MVRLIALLALHYSLKKGEDDELEAKEEEDGAVQ
jgi:hypothetical protein